MFWSQENLSEENPCGETCVKKTSFRH